MVRSPILITLLGSALLSLAACEKDPLKESLYNPHYWQRTDSSSAIYTRGPKAQQMLNSTIASCVTQLRELNRLGAIRYIMPADSHNGPVPDPDTPAGQLAEYETPTRDGMMRAEHLDFHDFETCMVYNGWERVEHVPYNVAEDAREVYTETILNQRYRSRTGDEGFSLGESDGDFETLND